MTELKPCPCCGSKAKIKKAYSVERNVFYFVKCTDILCGLSTECWGKKYVIAAWNKRAKEKEK